MPPNLSLRCRSALLIGCYGLYIASKRAGFLLGESIALAAAHRGDGTELVLGAPRFEGGGRRGAIYVVAAPSLGVMELETSDRAAGSSSLPIPGAALAVVDVDRDGRDDVLVGAVDAAVHGTGTGAVGLVLGGTW